MNPKNKTPVSATGPIAWVREHIAMVRLWLARKLVHSYNLDVFDAEQFALVGNYLARLVIATEQPKNKGNQQPTKFNKIAVRRKKIAPHLQRAVVHYQHAHWPHE